MKKASPREIRKIMEYINKSETLTNLFDDLDNIDISFKTNTTSFYTFLSSDDFDDLLDNDISKFCIDHLKNPCLVLSTEVEELILRLDYDLGTYDDEINHHKEQIKENNYLNDEWKKEELAKLEDFLKLFKKIQKELQD